MSTLTNLPTTLDDTSSSTTRKKRRKNVYQSLENYLPITKWLRTYTKFQAISDLVAGITLGLTMIPQSIAYASLAGLSAQYGLYSSFLGGFIYIFFGTVKEVSIGATSLMALVTFEFTKEMPPEFVILLTFLAGCVELLMGVLNLGFLVDFISIPVTSGFTSAASVIIIIAQLQGLTGLKYKSENIADNFSKLFQHLPDIRWTDFGLGITCITCLLSLRKLKDMNISFAKSPSRKEKIVKKALWFISISRNALIVLISSTITYHLHAKDCNPFLTSGKVKSGIPDFTPPPFTQRVGNETYTFADMCYHYGFGILVVPFVAVLTNVAIAKAFASGGAVNASQEMRTLGLCNIFGSFVSSMPTCGAFTRSAVSNASGVQTPMASLYSGIMTLLALSFLTPYFSFIPRATLASVLISAVIFMIDWRVVKLLWKGCKTDAIAAIVTFAVCVLHNVEVGLLIGVIFNLIILLRSPVRPKFEVSERKTESGTEYILIKPEVGLFYAAVDYFCEKVTKMVRKCEKTNVILILDCDRFRKFDYTAVKGIERLSKELNNDDHQLFLLHVSPQIVNRIEILGDTKHFLIIEDDDKIDEILQAHVSTNNAMKTQYTINLISEIDHKNVKNGKINDNKIEYEMLLRGNNTNKEDSQKEKPEED